jgi:hypothetical protein
MTDDATLGNKLKELADTIVDDAMTAPLEQKIAALKAVTTLHLGLRKISDKDEPDDADGGLPAMRERMRQAVEGK